MRTLEGVDVTPLERSARGGRFAVAVSAACPFLRGHFPDRPILPGVVQLGLAARAACSLLDEPLALVAVRHLRLRLPVLPGARLELGVAWDEAGGEAGGEARFELEAAGRVASSGLLAFARPRP